MRLIGGSILHAAVFMALSLVFNASLHADVIHVPGDQPTIQQGIDAAVDGDVVLVADGTYTGPLNRDLNPSGKRITIRSEKGPDHCIIDCGKLGRAFEMYNGENRDCRVMGFTILNGREGTGINTHGQGIYIYHSSPLIADCVIRECGLYYQGDQYGPTGGGIYILGGSPLIRDCVIEDNEAEWGGGIYAEIASPEIVRCTLRYNSAAAYIILGIPGPFFEGAGGGLYLKSCNNAMVSDCLIYGNDTEDDGGGARFSGGGGRIRNCVLTDNDAYGMWGDPDTGSALHFDNVQYWTAENLIVYDNHVMDSIRDLYGGTVVVRYCDVEGGYPGTGNFDADPKFMNVAAENFALKPGSPCIDAGHPAFVPTQYFEDPWGHSRLLDGNLDHALRVDVGAHEYSNIRTAIIGDTTPGSTVQYRVRGLDGLYYLVFGGITKLDPPPYLKPFGYLLVGFLPGFGPILPLGTIPDDVYLTIPPTAPVGAKFYLLPICRDGATYAGNFGAYVEVVIQ